jgi:hypothetical protein
MIAMNMADKNMVNFAGFNAVFSELSLRSLSTINHVVLFINVEYL